MDPWINRLILCFIYERDRLLPHRYDAAKCTKQTAHDGRSWRFTPDGGPCRCQCRECAGVAVAEKE